MNNVEKLMQDPKVIQATAFLKEDTENVLKEQLEIVQIPAPSNDEGERTEDFARRLNEMGYEPVTDGAGNVYAVIPGADPDGPTVLIAGHLDTVFPRTQPLNVTEQDGVYRCPGICDDTRALAEVLSLARAFKETGLQPVGNLILCGNVGEEGLGDLRGCKELFRTLSIDAFLSLDHWGVEDILLDATGSRRYQITILPRAAIASAPSASPTPSTPWAGPSALSPSWKGKRSPRPPLMWAWFPAALR